MSSDFAALFKPIIFRPSNRNACLRRAAARLSLLTPAALTRRLSRAAEEVIELLHSDWALRARADQTAPKCSWIIWLLLGGRGSGKTRAGAEWVRERIMAGARRIALVAPTYNDAREVMIEGESGLLNVGPIGDRPLFLSSRRRIEWPNGAVGHIFSGEDPDGLRGPQFDTAWADEFCAWRYPEKTLSNLRFGLRLPSEAGPPALTVTTTPRPTKALRALMETGGLVTSRARTRDNEGNLAPGFLGAVTGTYGGTRLGRQELDGEVMTDHPGALWTRDMIEAACSDVPQFSLRIFNREDYGSVIVALDPPVSTGASADACGIIVAGLTRSEGDMPARAVVLHDGTLQGRSPEGWAARAASLYAAYGADYMVAEANQGGDMVRTVLRHAGPDGEGVCVKTVHASASKTARAMPVALLYEQGRVSHAARFPALEDELCQLGADDQTGTSPDRADALVWAITELLLLRRTVPRVWTF